MRKVVDVVNFNSDASCLTSGDWLKFLKGGEKSPLVGLLRNYVELGKKVSLGIIGSTVADIATWNPEAIEFINRNREIFELILRPFCHDVALLRSRKGFELNFQYGKKTLEREFGQVESFFLPPEFMLTNYQVAQLAGFGVRGVFVNANRFSQEIKSKIPEKPYVLKGVNNTTLPCIPFTGDLTRRYLDSIHFYDATPWNRSIEDSAADVTFSWRDGESPLLIPDGISREKEWLRTESPDIKRLFLSEATRSMHFEALDHAQTERIKYYPVHSFLAWVKEFRMLGFVQKINEYENDLEAFSLEKIALWMALINSDILSAVEKSSPVVSLLDKETSQHYNFTIWRSERGFEGEDYLYLFENFNERKELLSRKDSHILRVKHRMEYIMKLGL